MTLLLSDGTGQLKSASLSHANFSYSYVGDDIRTVVSSAKQTGAYTGSYTYNYVAGTSKLSSITGSSYSQFGYDPLNRVTSDGVRVLSYDAFGRMQSAGSSSYYYAPDDLRVRATRASVGTTDYVYGLEGELLYELDRSTGLAQHYVHVGDQLLASIDSYPNTDTDRDGVLDLEELEYGLNPNVYDAYKDSDDDGIPDYLERFLGLNPTQSDTDGDGFSDGYEYKTLGLEAALKASITPSEPEPPRDNISWMVPILDLILS